MKRENEKPITINREGDMNQYQQNMDQLTHIK